MTRAAALAQMPGDAQVPVSWVQELLAEQERERIEGAAVRAETIAVYEALATRHLTQIAG
jgi:hypothetical protein